MLGSYIKVSLASTQPENWRTPFLYWLSETAYSIDSQLPSTSGGHLHVQPEELLRCGDKEWKI
jgi:hypothetical protein